jgi:hypothetical protein
MEKTVFIPFARKDDKVVHISKVENGLECGCYCLACGAQLIAKKGDVRIHHFAHYNCGTCNNALETALHKGAKQILAEEKRIVLPDFIDYTKSNTQEFNRIEVEKTFVTPDQRIIADIVGYYNEKEPFIIELAVTHPIGEQKRNVLRNLGIPSIEVNIFIGLNEDYSNIKDVLIENTSFKNWIYHPFEKTLVADARKEICEKDKYIMKLKGEVEKLENEIRILEEFDSKRAGSKEAVGDLESQIRSLESEWGESESEHNDKSRMIKGYVGMGWGPRIEKAITLSLCKEDLMHIPADKWGHIRIVIQNRKEIDLKTRSKLAVFVDKYFYGDR